MNTAISLIPASAPDAPPALTPYAQRTIRRAVNLLDKHLRQPGVIFTSAASVRDWLRLQLSPLEREVFMVLFLNNQHQLLAHETLFTGGVRHTEVHPREVLRAAMRHNAAAVMLAYRWTGSVCHYAGRHVPDISGVLAVFAERRQERHGPYALLRCVTLN
ncbi:DUF987 family protein [Salmonella enterica subsp. enterica serovar Horsham]|nr:DUF987 family protein [Salmonella enterica subsp. enterica serovar Horsham]